MFGGSEKGPESTWQSAERRDSERKDPERKARIKANLEYELRDQLNGQQITIGEIILGENGEFDNGVLGIGEQTFRFMTSKDDKIFFLVAAGPYDVSLTEEQRAEALLDAEREAAEIARDRHVELDIVVKDLPYRGAKNGAVTLVEFSDFQCPFCKSASSVVEEILKKYPDEVRFSYMHFPLDMHPWAMPAAVTAVCTAQQDPEAFWALHDAYFANQNGIVPLNLIDKSREFVEGTGIDMLTWTECVEDPESESHLGAVVAVQESIALGNRYGLTGTPGFFINGIFVRGAPPIEQFSALIDEALGN